MLLLVGLGNPGSEYVRNRHNVGFMAVDEIAHRQAFGAARRRFQGALREGHLDGRKTLILKPTTFMNASGRAVGEAVRFYKLEPQDIVVFHDEIDLMAGKLRLKQGGGVAGHNGLRSIDAHIGRDFRRVRIGVGRPRLKQDVERYVLRDFAKADQQWLEPLIDAIAEAASLLAADDDAGFATKVALIVKPPEKKPRPEPLSDAKPTVQGSGDPEN